MLVFWLTIEIVCLCDLAMLRPLLCLDGVTLIVALSQEPKILVWHHMIKYLLTDASVIMILDCMEQGIAILNIKHSSVVSQKTVKHGGFVGLCTKDSWCVKTQRKWSLRLCRQLYEDFNMFPAH